MLFSSISNICKRNIKIAKVPNFFLLFFAVIALEHPRGVDSNDLLVSVKLNPKTQPAGI